MDNKRLIFLLLVFATLIHFQAELAKYKVAIHFIAKTITLGQLIITEDNRALKYSRTPLMRINWEGEPSGYADNPYNWIFL
jgi:hypothetical protein